MTEETNQGAGGLGGGDVQSTDQGGTTGAEQTVQSTVGNGEFDLGGEKFTVESLKQAYPELRKKFTQETQKIAEERRANEWWTSRLRDIQKGSPNDWNTLKSLLNGKKLAAAPSAAPQAAAQTQVDPRIEEFERGQKLTEAKLEIMEFQRKHADVSEDQLKDLVKFVVEQDVDGRNYSLEDAFIIKNHKSELAKAATDSQKKTEDSIKKGQSAAALGTAATTAQVPQKGKNFRKIKDENEVNKYFEGLLKKHGGKTDGD